MHADASTARARVCRSFSIHCVEKDDSDAHKSMCVNGWNTIYILIVVGNADIIIIEMNYMKTKKISVGKQCVMRTDII